MNSCNFTGRIGQEPNVITFQNGDKQTTFSIAVDNGYFDKENNKWVDRVVWVNIVRRGETKFRKGDLVEVSGKLNTRQYETKNNEKRYITEVIANSVKLLNRKDDASPKQYQNVEVKSEQAKEVPEQEMDEHEPIEGSDDLPF